jgi:hypothetical protein
MNLEKVNYPPFEEFFSSESRMKVLKILTQDEELTTSLIQIWESE